jgi:BirA family biotin operon repressor/biotin-[acetyl-CoA-carboxylase] ligase
LPDALNVISFLQSALLRGQRLRCGVKRCLGALVGGLFLFSGDIPGMLEPCHPARLRRYPFWEADPAADPDAWLPADDRSPTWYRCIRRDPRCAVTICGPCSSCLDVAWFLLEQGLLPEGGSVATPLQRSGRGQYRRGWLSPAGNLYVAIRLPLAGKRSAAPLSAITGVRLVQALQELGFPVLWKWPNDLVANGGKAGGILVEERGAAALAGIGLNLNLAPGSGDAVGPHTLRPAALCSPETPGKPVSLWLDLLHAMWPRLDAARSGGAHPLSRAEAERCMGFLGRRIMVHRQGREPFVARLLGLSADFGLRIEVDGREEVLANASMLPLDPW